MPWIWNIQSKCYKLAFKQQIFTSDFLSVTLLPDFLETNEGQRGLISQQIY